MKQLIIQAILSTDVSKHFANLEHLKKLLAGKKPGLKQIPEEEERYVLFSLASFIWNKFFMHVTLEIHASSSRSI